VLLQHLPVYLQMNVMCQDATLIFCLRPLSFACCNCWRDDEPIPLLDHFSLPRPTLMPLMAACEKNNIAENSFQKYYPKNITPYKLAMNTLF
jgi:hypothetical protein